MQRLAQHGADRHIAGFELRQHGNRVDQVLNSRNRPQMSEHPYLRGLRLQHNPPALTTGRPQPLRANPRPRSLTSSGHTHVATALPSVRLARQADPGRRMVAGVLLTTHPTIDTGRLQARRKIGAEQQMVDTQPGIFLPVLTEIVPEGIDRFVRKLGAQGIGPALSQQALIARAAFRLQQRILARERGL